MVESIVVAIAGGLVSWLIWSWRLRQRVAAALTGEQFEVPAKLRLLAQSGLSGRWREGILHRSDGQLIFRPRKPRPGPTLEMSGSTITEERTASAAERWWFAGRTVLRGEGPIGVFEVGTGSPEYVELVRTLFDGTSGAAP